MRLFSLYAQGGDVLDPTTAILLRWRPGHPDDRVAFYSLEYAGPAGCVGAELRYKEICRDPPSAQEGPNCRFQYRLAGLDPATSYLFRIRAVNGIGASEYTYLSVSTRLVMAIYPRVVRLTQDSVTLRWLFTPQSHRRLAALRKVYFDELASNEDYVKAGRKDMRKDDLARILDEAAETSRDLKHFLKKAKAKHGIQDYAVSHR